MKGNDERHHSGTVSDPDAGALRGIAVTAASDFRGTWQFSLNGGATWQNQTGRLAESESTGGQ